MGLLRLILCGIIIHCFSININAQSISFSVERGYFNKSFQVNISSDISNAKIYYTLDGSNPNSTNGKLYKDEINVKATSTITAVAFSSEDTSKIVTHTYLFENDILNQIGTLDTFKYDLNSNVVSKFKADIIKSFSTIPTISLVLPIDSMFDASRGIYAQPFQRGVDWERATSFEFIDPKVTNVQVNAGLRIHGATIRSFRKKSFRLYFKSEYGDSKLKHPIFTNPTATKKFDHLVLHQGGHQDSFGGFRNEKATYLKNRFANELLLNMNQVSSNGRFSHLYINGTYWGLYHILERPKAAFYSAYLDGKKEDFDVIKGETLSQPEIANGTDAYWNQMIALISNGVESEAAYKQIQHYINVKSLIDYIVLTHTLGNRDWDNRNWMAARNAKQNEQFIFMNWDSDAIFDGFGKEDDLLAFHYYKNNENMPTYIFRQLQNNEQFKSLLADRIEMHFSTNGALSPNNMQNVFKVLSSEIELAIKAEAARWGNQKFISQWNDRINYLQNEWLLNRSNVVKNLYTKYKVLNHLSKPQISISSNFVDKGQQINLNSNNTIYYTLDGSDPIGNDGNPSTNAIKYTTPIIIDNSLQLKARAISKNEKCNMALYKPTKQSSTFKSGKINAHYASRANDGIVDDRSEWKIYGGSIAKTETNNQPWWQIDLQETAFIKNINIYAPDCCEDLSNFYVLISNEDFNNESLSKTLNQKEVTSFKQYNCKEKCSISINAEARYIRIQLEADKAILNLAEVEIEGGCNDWSTLQEASYYLKQDYSQLMLNEINYNPSDSITNQNKIIDGDNYESIEIYNNGNQVIDMSHIYFSDGIKFKFPIGSTVQPNSCIVLAKNEIEFQNRYGFKAEGQYNGKLSNKGETIILNDPLGNIIDQATYSAID